MIFILCLMVVCLKVSALQDKIIIKYIYIYMYRITLALCNNNNIILATDY